MATASLVILSVAIQEAERFRLDFRGTLSSYGTQLDYELMQLIDHISRYSDGDATIGLNDVLSRFDVMSNRVEMADLPGRGQEFQKLPGSKEVLTDLSNTLETIEPALRALPPNAPEPAIELLDRLRGIAPFAHRVAVLSINHDADRKQDVYSREIRRNQLSIYLIAGFLGFVALSLAYAVYEAGRFRQLSETLEKRVQARTEEVSAVNASLAREINERAYSESELALREDRLRQAAKLAQLGYYVWDTISRKCVFCSEQHARAHGLTPEDVIGADYQDDALTRNIHPDDRDIVKDAHMRLSRGEMVDFEYRVVTPDGVRRLREIAQPLIGDDGQITREIGTSLDITEQFDTERKLAAAQRLEAIGQLTGGVAHDFNNILAVILGNLEFLQDDISATERKQLIDETIRSILRGRDLTRDMLAFARQSTLVPEDLELNGILVSFGAMIRRLLPSSIRIETALDADLWPVTLDKSSFENAILNLAINARDAMPDGGQLTIESTNLLIDNAYLQEHEEDATPGRYVMVALTDTGIGIGDDIVARVCEPFFTTKEAGRGSGLGLSMVQGFVEQSGGFLRIDSELENGTSMKLFFPAAAFADPSPNQADTNQRKPGPEDTGVRILLVEDESAVRKVIATGLRRAGFDVTETHDSQSAEQAFEHEGPFDLLLTDIVMPGELQGPALAQRLRMKAPDLPTILMSGYPNEAMLNGEGLRAEDIRLMKPVRRSDLVAAVKKALDLP